MNVTCFSSTRKSHEFQSRSDQLVVSSASQSGRMSNKERGKNNRRLAHWHCSDWAGGGALMNEPFGMVGLRWVVHSEHCFPAPSSRLCQHWRSTLSLREAVLPRCRRPPKVFGTAKTFCFCFCLICYLLLARWNCPSAVHLCSCCVFPNCMNSSPISSESLLMSTQ